MDTTESPPTTDGAVPSTSTGFHGNEGVGNGGPFKRPPIVSPRGGGIKKRLGIPNASLRQQQQMQHTQHVPQRGRDHYGRGRAAFQQNHNRFRYANAVINGGRNGMIRHNVGRQQHPPGREQHHLPGRPHQILPQQRDETIFIPPSRIRFTQSTVKSTFNDGRSLVETYEQLATRKIKKRDIPMIDVVEKDGQYWTLNNRRLAVFSQLERKGKCKVVRVRVRPPTEAVTEWLLRNTTTNSGKAVKIRLMADEAEKCPAQELELFEDLLTGVEPENNRKPANWSRDQYEREKIEKEESERAMRNPQISVPDGWGAKRLALPVVGEASTSSAPLAGSDEVMFEEKDLSFEIEDLLLDGDNANSSSARDSGRGSSSNVSEACSQNGNRTYAADEVFDAEEIDFDNEGLYLDGVPELETIEDVANAESSAPQRASSPTPSEALTSTFGHNFRLHSPVRRQFIVEESSAPFEAGRQVVADSSSSSAKDVLPVGRVLNAGKRKRQLAYYFLKKYGQPRAKMMPKPDNSDLFFCGCGHREEKLSELGRHKDKSGHWAFKGTGFDSLRYLIDFEDLRINPPASRQI